MVGCRENVEAADLRRREIFRYGGEREYLFQGHQVVSK